MRKKKYYFFSFFFYFFPYFIYNNKKSEQNICKCTVIERISKYILNSVIDIDTGEREKNVDIRRIHLHFVYFLNNNLYYLIIHFKGESKIKGYPPVECGAGACYS